MKNKQEWKQIETHTKRKEEWNKNEKQMEKQIKIAIIFPSCKFRKEKSMNLNWNEFAKK